jgi:hypothetical protein
MNLTALRQSAVIAIDIRPADNDKVRRKQARQCR